MYRLTLTFKDKERPNHFQDLEERSDAVQLFCDYSVLEHIETVTLHFVKGA